MAPHVVVHVVVQRDCRVTAARTVTMHRLRGVNAVRRRRGLLLSGCGRLRLGYRSIL